MLKIYIKLTIATACQFKMPALHAILHDNSHLFHSIMKSLFVVLNKVPVAFDLSLTLHLSAGIIYILYYSVCSYTHTSMF